MVIDAEEGGVAKSADGVLSIALFPGAFAENTEVCIQQSDDPPPVFGPAYRVKPNVALDVPATLTYRHELPPDPSGVTIGRVDRDEFEAGNGKWIPLPVLDISVEDSLVTSQDDELSLFYGLLADGGIASTGDSSAESGSAEQSGSSDAGTTGSGSMSTSGNVDETSGPATVTASDTSNDTGSSDTGTVFPPECDNIYMGPYALLASPALFEPMTSEDLAMSGNSTFVARSGTGLVTVDAEDASTSPHPLETPFMNQTLGLRYRADGDLVAVQREIGELWLIHDDGTIDTFFDGLNFPNGVFPDHSDYVWVTDFFANTVYRIEPDGSDSTVITDLAPQANGILFDEVRQMVFWSLYGDSQLWRAPIGNDGTPGAPVMVADLEGTTDGITQDVCGHVYTVDQNDGGASRLDRVWLDLDGNQTQIEEIAGTDVLVQNCANAQFGFGPGLQYEDALYVTGFGGTVYVIDMQITGAPIAPVPL